MQKQMHVPPANPHESRVKKEIQSSGTIFMLLAKSTRYYQGQIVISLREVTPPLQGRTQFHWDQYLALRAQTTK